MVHRSKSPAGHRPKPAGHAKRGRREEEQEGEEGAFSGLDFHALPWDQKLDTLITLREHCLRTIQVHNLFMLYI